MCGTPGEIKNSEKGWSLFYYMPAFFLTVTQTEELQDWNWRKDVCVCVVNNVFCRSMHNFLAVSNIFFLPHITCTFQAHTWISGSQVAKDTLYNIALAVAQLLHSDDFPASQSSIYCLILSCCMETSFTFSEWPGSESIAGEETAIHIMGQNTDSSLPS